MSMLAEVANLHLRRDVFMLFTFFPLPWSRICPGVAVGVGVGVGVAVGLAVGVGVGVPAEIGSLSVNASCWDWPLIVTRPSTHEVRCSLAIAEP
ncbi:MAG: hypothetical protein DME84_08020 [Verrucomicrobia bacterium]|nr:MAG: hypothetical protein DME84_08020 [Verrucomicrobiota bacterium]